MHTAPVAICSIVSSSSSSNNSRRRYRAQSHRTLRPNVVARRELAEHLLRRSSFLSPPDRSLVHSVLDAGMSPAQIAQLAGVCPETVRRRLRKLLAHLSSDFFTFVLTHRGSWPVARRRIADLRYLQRCSLRETSVKADMSMHCVRRHADAIYAQYEAVQRNQGKGC